MNFFKKIGSIIFFTPFLLPFLNSGCGMTEAKNPSENFYYDSFSGGDWSSSPPYRDGSTSSEFYSYDSLTDIPAPDVLGDIEEEIQINVCDLPVPEPQILYLSADDSNSQASPIIARWMINQNMEVPWYIIRTYEFTNYYDLNYQPAQFGRVNVFAQMKADDEKENHYNLQIGVQSHTVNSENRRPMSITFSLDTSGSMSGTPIELEKAVCREIAGNLRSGDIVSMVKWNDQQAIVLDSYEVTGPNDSRLLDAISGLSADGSTDLHSGLVLAYQLANRNRRDGWLSRVILISDGQANTGVTDEQIIAQNADDSEREGIYLVGVGVGNGYDDTLMDTVTDKGKGAYIFIDSEEEAHKMFGERFYQNLEIAVMDVRVQLTLPSILRMEIFFGEEVSTNPKEVEPQHLAPNDAMIFGLDLVSCGDLSETDTIKALATYIDPSTRENRNDFIEIPVLTLLDGEKRLVEKGVAIIKYAEGLKKISRAGTVGERYEICISTKDYVSRVAASLGDSELQEIQSLLERYCLLFQ